MVGERDGSVAAPHLQSCVMLSDLLLHSVWLGTGNFTQELQEELGLGVIPPEVELLFHFSCVG